MAINKDFIVGYGAGKASKTSQTIIEETDAWLEENISQETGYVLDRTLAMQNAAAPADMVGDLKSALTSTVRRTEDYTSFADFCRKGSFSVSTSTWSNTNYKQNARISVDVDTPLILKAGTIISIPYGYRIFIAYRSNNKYYQYSWAVADFVCPVDAEYVFSFGKYDDTDFVNMTVQDIAKLISIIPSENNTLNKYIKELTFTPHGKIKSIARLGYNISDNGTPPENSIEGYKAALEHGYDIMLANVRWTSDHVPVALHDLSINSVARNSDGTALSDTVNINEITLNDADSYDFGIIKGAKYAGTKIMRIADFVDWCIKKGVYIFLEIKIDGATVTQDDFDELYAILDRYNIGNHSILHIDNNELRTAMHSRYPEATMSLSFSDGSDIATIFGKAAQVKGNNDVFVYVYAKEDFSYMISKSLVDAAVSYNVKLGLTECKNETNFEAFLASDYGLSVDYLAIRDMPFYTYMHKKNAGF